MAARVMDPQQRPPLKAIALETYAGRHYHPCEIVGETNKYYQVKILPREGYSSPVADVRALAQLFPFPNTQSETYRKRI